MWLGPKREYILNAKGVYIDYRCTVPDLAVVHKDKVWQEEEDKFKEISNKEQEERDNILEGEESLDYMIAARVEERKKRKEEHVQGR